MASMLTHAVFWIALGWISAWLFRRAEGPATQPGLNPAL
jgi:predicted cobalt transporter CbtA